MMIGSFIAAYSIEVLLIPNQIIDGGIIGISILISQVFNENWLYPLVLILNIPFILIAFKHISKSFVLKMLFALIVFVCFGHWIADSNLSFFW